MTLMRSHILGLAAAASVLGAATPSFAGVYADDLSKCLVASTTTDDHTALMQWIFVAVTANPKLSSMASVTADQRTDIDVKAAAVFERLLTTDCRKEVVAALKYEGVDSLDGAFEVLGQVSARDLMTNQATQTELGGLLNHLDKQKLADLVKEAGLPPDSGGK